MKFFFDTCISPKIVRVLKILVEYQPVEVIHLNERFPPETKDEEWLTKLGQEGDWVIVSGDPRITRGKAERAAWKSSGLTAFFLRDGWANQTVYEQAADIIKRWPEIVRCVKENPVGTGFLIPKQADIEPIKSR